MNIRLEVVCRWYDISVSLSKPKRSNGQSLAGSRNLRRGTGRAVRHVAEREVAEQRAEPEAEDDQDGQCRPQGSLCGNGARRWSRSRRCRDGSERVAVVDRLRSSCRGSAIGWCSSASMFCASVNGLGVTGPTMCRHALTLTIWPKPGRELVPSSVASALADSKITSFWLARSSRRF